MTPGPAIRSRGPGTSGAASPHPRPLRRRLQRGAAPRHKGGRAMSLAGQEGRQAFARNTSWGGSSNTSWGGSSNTSWGGSQNTSWGGGRGRAAMAALAVVLPILAVLPFAHPAGTQRVVVVGAHASQALHGVGASHVSLLTNGVAVGRASAAGS